MGQELTVCIKSSTEIISSNIIGPFPNLSVNPSEKFRKTSGYLDNTKKALVATTDKVFKEGNTDMVDKKIKTKLFTWINR